MIYSFTPMYYSFLSGAHFLPYLSLFTNIKQNRLSLKSLEQKLAKLEKSSNDDNSNNKDSENIIVRIRKGSVIVIKHCTDLR